MSRRPAKGTFERDREALDPEMEPTNAPGVGGELDPEKLPHIDGFKSVGEILPEVLRHLASRRRRGSSVR